MVVLLLFFLHIVSYVKLESSSVLPNTTIESKSLSRSSLSDKQYHRGGVAQWVARLTCNVEAVGSSPIKGPRCFLE